MRTASTHEDSGGQRPSAAIRDVAAAWADSQETSDIALVPCNARSTDVWLFSAGDWRSMSQTAGPVRELAEHLATTPVISAQMISMGAGPGDPGVFGLAVPVVVGEVSWGTALVMRPKRFSDRDLGVASAMAAVVATTVELESRVAGMEVEAEERRRVETELNHSRDLMRYVIEHNGSATAVLDTSMVYLYVSERFLEEYAVEERDVIGKCHYSVFPDLPERWRVIHQRVLAGEVLSEEADPYVHEDGTTHWTTWSCRPWYGPNGDIGGIVLYTEVINERKWAEERLLKYQRQLRDLAAELNASVDREQRRLALELHDGVGQVLAAANMQARVLAETLTDSEPSAQATKVAELLDEAFKEVRALTTQLAPSMLLDRGLDASLQWLIERYHELYGLQCALRMRTEPDMSAGMEADMFIFRVIRESLNNVTRHSGVRSAVVTVIRTKQHAFVRVCDKGAGFDPDVDGPDHPKGIGLLSMREECLARAGSFDVMTAPGAGTRLTVSVPLDPAAWYT